MSDLKPCPFCGGEADLDFWWNENGDGGRGKVICIDCRTEMAGSDHSRPITEAEKVASKAEAIAAWNRRAIPAVQPMTEITADVVKTLREKTGAGMWDAKRALAECLGDMDEAVEWLRYKGTSHTYVPKHKRHPAVQPDARIKGYEDAYRYALHLAEALRENYPPNPDFRFLGDLVGLLTQIDNMVAGLPKPAVQPHVNETPKSEHDAANMLTPATKGGDA